MNYKEMLPLMGQVVTVKAELRHRGKLLAERTWSRQECHAWAGWVVGVLSVFLENGDTLVYNGTLIYILTGKEEVKESNQ